MSDFTARYDEMRRAKVKEAKVGWLGVAALLALAIPLLIWKGWAIATLWGWFIAPPFGVPEISTYQAAGVLAFLAAVMQRAKTDSPSTAAILGTAIFGPPFAVAFGWLFKALFL